MGRLRLALGIVVATAGAASADTRIAMDDQLTMEQRWPAVPADHALSLGDQITDHLTDYGNQLCAHIDLLSHDMIGLHVDGRAQRARIRLGGGNPHYLTLRIDSDWLFSNGHARVDARVELGLAGHLLDIKLPTMEVIPDSYHGEQLVEINVPLLERRF
ncbi:MAG TPA: hypothetical protein VLX92_15865 [Kofleriaceae bacterium]|nr:hypothetical protein [Kofleriaceae bacterium]